MPMIITVQGMVLLCKTMISINRLALDPKPSTLNPKLHTLDARQFEIFEGSCSSSVESNEQQLCGCIARLLKCSPFPWAPNLIFKTLNPKPYHNLNPQPKPHMLLWGLGIFQMLIMRFLASVVGFMTWDFGWLRIWGRSQGSGYKSQGFRVCDFGLWYRG